MSGIRPHYHLPSTEQITKLIADTRELAARSAALLQSLQKPNMFLGHKTQEPFPQETNLPPADEN